MFQRTALCTVENFKFNKTGKLQSVLQCIQFPRAFSYSYIFVFTYSRICGHTIARRLDADFSPRSLGFNPECPHIISAGDEIVVDVVFVRGPLVFRANHPSTIAPYMSISALWGVWYPWKGSTLSHPRSLRWMRHFCPSTWLQNRDVRFIHRSCHQLVTFGVIGTICANWKGYMANLRRWGYTGTCVERLRKTTEIFSEDGRDERGQICTHNPLNSNQGFSKSTATI
jgi:hypothetical protein